MAKPRITEVKPLLRKAAADPKAKLSARQIQPAAKIAENKTSKKETNKDEVVHLHQNEEQSPNVIRPIPWWVFPQGLERGLHGHGGHGLGGHGGHGGGLGGGPGGHGHGPFPPSPPFPGHGHFPGPFPGPFPGQFFPGPFFPGPFFPGPFFPGSFFPGPFPVPVPVPVPVAVPRPQEQPLPVTPAFVTVRITGSDAFPRANYTNYVPFSPGMTIRQTLVATGLVDFGPKGFIHNVAGIPIADAVGVSLRYNGRVVPQTVLDASAEPGGIVGLELYYSSTDAIPVPL
ncbi:hypothetical protein [Cohnella terricola]|uniref:Uncharacterized protein n=1 Tax=Cohnella terricola TaxID=1289167 RepID=A0A559JMQ9_9BACL|nr:hypothetical protein [Cohnella terricola]TVY01157.1 hypothetical protein FPZ45_08365 [Cohnella terricola]